jgi:hypothetical protein
LLLFLLVDLLFGRIYILQASTESLSFWLIEACYFSHIPPRFFSCFATTFGMRGLFSAALVLAQAFASAVSVREADFDQQRDREVASPAIGIYPLCPC